VNEKTETTKKPNQRGAAVNELLLAITTFGAIVVAAAVVACAIGDPKIPPYVGD